MTQKSNKFGTDHKTLLFIFNIHIFWELVVEEEAGPCRNFVLMNVELQ